MKTNREDSRHLANRGAWRAPDSNRLTHSRAGSSIMRIILLLVAIGVRSQELPYQEQTTWLRVDSITYGAKQDHRGPLGGGRGYVETYATGDYIVTNLDELQNALDAAQPGEVIFIPNGVELDLTALVFAEGYSILVPAGVTLAGDRGSHGSPGALIRSLAFRTPAAISAAGPSVRITGLRIEGPDKSTQSDHYRRAFTGRTAEEIANRVGQQYFYRLPNSDGIVTEHDELHVDNCELWGWSHSAIYLRSGESHNIHHNYIHQNQRQGLGYGVCLGSAFSSIEFNVFSDNRHSIAGTGVNPSGYLARNNVVLGDSVGHAFDMHGGRDRGDGTSVAGSRIEISNNTFYTSARAIGIRGVPAEYAYVTRNWFYQDTIGPDVLIDWPPRDRVHVRDNIFGARLTTDESTIPPAKDPS